METSLESYSNGNVKWKYVAMFLSTVLVGVVGWVYINQNQVQASIDLRQDGQLANISENISDIKGDIKLIKAGLGIK